MSEQELNAALVNLLAVAYNVVVNRDSERMWKKLDSLQDAINNFERAVGKKKLEYLVDCEVIEKFNPCHDDCIVKAGGLRHVEGCENDMNHPVYLERVRLCEEQIPLGINRQGGRAAGEVTLVGK